MDYVSGLWPDFLAAGKDFPDMTINKIVIDRDRKHIFLSLFCDIFSRECIDRFGRYITKKYPQYTVEVEYTFDKNAADSHACRFIIDKLSGRMPVNGFFNGCEISLGGGEVSFKLGHGGASVLQALDFEREFSIEYRKMFGYAPAVTLCGITEVETVAEEQNPKPPAVMSRKKMPEQAPQKRQRKLDTAEFENGFVELENDGYEPVMGKKPLLKALCSLEQASCEQGSFTVWGRVFSKDVRETRNGNTIYTVGMTDYTGSIYIKVIERSGKVTPVNKLGEGDTIVAAGVVEESKFDNDYVFSPKDIIRVNPKRRKDNAARKRVELHLHTNMSAMDAIPPVKDVINRAAEYGHSAVAITDHGVLQAFPDTQKTVKKIRNTNPDFKVIYGVECYYVDDSAKVVFGAGDTPLDGEFICFDLETTGLSAQNERITEIGAVRVMNREIVDSFVTFVNPERPIPPENTRITGITDEMVKDAPAESKALVRFLDFAGDCPLVAHNASFDMAFLSAALKRHDIQRSFVTLDTLALSQVLLPDLGRHRLDTLTRHFKLPSFNHHRANDDAAALARVFIQLTDMLYERGITVLGEVNQSFKGRNIKHVRPNHMILLVRDKTGLKNLYQLVTKSHLDYFANKRPRIPLSELLKHREGLVIGSACEAGEVYTALLEGRPWEEVKQRAAKYDYLEIQPRGNNMFLVDKGVLPDAEAILELNRQVVRLGEELGKPVAATCDVHYLDRRDAVYRDIVSNGPGFEENNSEQSLDYKTTEEMLAEFAYLGEDMAKKVVIDNTTIIADMISPDVQPIPEGTFTPEIAGSNEDLLDMVERSIKARYGENPDGLISARAKKELDSIIGNNYAVLYIIAQKLVSKSEQDGYHVGSRGSVGSSFIANLIGISEVNPLPPHFLCEKCRHFEFVPEAGSGFDLPDRQCPNCDTVMRGDGHDIPFETFLGFEGEKQPDIDLNFSGEYQAEAHKYTSDLFGSDHVFKAGTISALKEKTAYGYVKKYLEEKCAVVNKAEENRLVLGCTGIKRTTGQHPGGMVVVPQAYDITDFTPAQHPADRSEQGVVTTHFDFSSLHDTLLKLDELGHDVPTMYHYIEELTGKDVNEVPMNDPEVMKLFTAPEPLGLAENDIDSKTGTFGIPEMGTATVRGLLIDSQPKLFSDLVQVSGLSHGTDVWAGNAQALIKDGTCTIKNVIGTRDSIMVELMKKGVGSAAAFEIMELTRRGKAAEGFTEQHLAEMRKNRVPEWYIESCKKIKYMFPKAHAAAYVISAIRLAWFKLYYPLEFYATFFTVRGSDIDVDAAVGGQKAAKKRLAELKSIMRDETRRTPKDEETYVVVQMLCEMLCRGYEFLPINFEKSHATMYRIEDGKLRLPFIALKGIGENAAKAAYDAAKKGGYLSAEDILIEPGITPSLIEALDETGAFGSLPKSRQLSLF